MHARNDGNRAQACCNWILRAESPQHKTKAMDPTQSGKSLKNTSSTSKDSMSVRKPSGFNGQLQYRRQCVPTRVLPRVPHIFQDISTGRLRDNITTGNGKTSRPRRSVRGYRHRGTDEDATWSQQNLSRCGKHHRKHSSQLSPQKWNQIATEFFITYRINCVTSPHS